MQLAFRKPTHPGDIPEVEKIVDLGRRRQKLGDDGSVHLDGGQRHDVTNWFHLLLEVLKLLVDHGAKYTLDLRFLEYTINVLEWNLGFLRKVIEFSWSFYTLMNETRRRPITGTWCPTLFNKWVSGGLTPCRQLRLSSWREHVSASSNHKFFRVGWDRAACRFCVLFWRLSHHAHYRGCRCCPAASRGECRSLMLWVSNSLDRICTIMGWSEMVECLQARHGVGEN